jgi:hypothetical protein
MPFIDFRRKIGDIGTFVDKMKLFVAISIAKTAYDEQDVTICK